DDVPGLADFVAVTTTSTSEFNAPSDQADSARDWTAAFEEAVETTNDVPVALATEPEIVSAPSAPVVAADPAPVPASAPFKPNFDLTALQEALEVVRQMDPVGVACRDLRECLLAQVKYHQQAHKQQKNGDDPATAQVLADAHAIVDQHLRAMQNKQY